MPAANMQDVACYGGNIPSKITDLQIEKKTDKT